MRGIPIEFEVEAAANFDRREITAYMSRFMVVDREGHRVLPTAFNNSIPRIQKGEVPLFRDHDTNIGTLKHGEPDSTGFLTVGYVSKTRDGDETLEKVRDGSIRHYSFSGPVMPGRATVVVEKAEDGTERAVLNLAEIKLRECGPVMNKWAVNEGATILSVKAFSEVELDMLYDLPYIVKSLVLGRKSVSGEEERMAKAALRVYEALGEDADLLKAMLAPERHLAPQGDADKSTPAEAEKKHPDLTPLLESLRKRGRIAA